MSSLRPARLVACSLLLLLPSLFLSPSHATVNVSGVLSAYGLPPNLIPDAVLSYKLDENKGDFSASLSQDCYSRFPNTTIRVFYGKAITGRVSMARLSNLKGIKASLPGFFFWVTINAVYQDGPNSDTIHFVGPFGIDQAFPMSIFDPPDVYPPCASSMGSRWWQPLEADVA